MTISRAAKDRLLLLLFIVFAALATLIIATSVGFLQALGIIATLVTASFVITITAVRLASRSAMKSLQEVALLFAENGSQALEVPIALSILDLPTSEQEKLIRKLARQYRVPEQQTATSLEMLRNSRYQTPLDRMRAAMATLLLEESD